MGGEKGGEHGHQLKDPSTWRSCTPALGRGVAVPHRRWKRRVGGATAPGVGAQKARSRGLYAEGATTEGGGSCAQNMVRAERNTRMVSLDERDHALLLSLLEHKVLTTHQIKSLFFRSFRRCQHWMKELRDLGVVSSFTVGRGFGEGRPPACWFLTKAGLAEIAEAKDIHVSDLPWVPDYSYRSNLLLAHRLGVNAFFCALAEASRDHDGHCLHTWRPEHWVRTRSAEVKPDGFGRYLHPGGACEFYLEYDRGTEAFGALSRKLKGYLRLAAGWTKEQELTGFPNLLIIVPEAVREGEVASALRYAIGSLPISGSLATSFPLHVASEEQLVELGVLGAAWKHLPTDGYRLSLVHLPAQPRDLFQSTRCLGRYFTDERARRRISPVSTTPRFTAMPRHGP